MDNNLYTIGKKWEEIIYGVQKIPKIDMAKFSEVKYVAWNFSSLSDVSRLRLFIRCMTEMHQQVSRNNLF